MNCIFLLSLYCRELYNLNSNHSNLFHTNGEIYIHECGFERNNEYNGDGGAISIFCETFIFKLYKSWFFACTSTGRGGCVYICLSSTLSLFNMSSVCGSYSYTKDIGNFAFISLQRNFENESTYFQCSNSHCFNPNQLSDEVISLLYCWSSIRKTNFSHSSSSYGPCYSYCYTTTASFFETIFANHVVANGQYFLTLKSLYSLKSDYVQFLNLSSDLRSDGSVMLIEFSNVKMMNCEFIDNRLTLAQINSGELHIINSSFINQKRMILPSLYLVNITNSSQRMPNNEAYSPPSCFSGYVFTTESQKKRFEPSYIIVSLIIALLIITSSLLIIYRKYNVVNDEILLGKTINLEFG